MAMKRSARPTVLMVEDDLEFAADLLAVLDGIVNIERVSTTTAAAASLLRGLPDLLWLDLDLPTFFAQTGGLEGIAFLRLVRERLAPDLPVIVVSGQLTPELRQELGQQRVNACFGKPPEVSELARALTALSRARTPAFGNEHGRSRSGSE